MYAYNKLYTSIVQIELLIKLQNRLLTLKQIFSNLIFY